jgi:threonine dehydrogenase-like Zn-dependent dehydrogenase
VRTLDGIHLPETIEAVVLEAPETLSLRRIPMWPLADYGDEDLVLVRVDACGICGSDLRYFMGENPWAQHTLGRHADNPPNIVLGHEFTGIVAAVLSKENEQLLGRRVAPICSKVCGACRFCRTGREHLCPETVHLGHGQGWGERDFFPGAYAEYVPAWGKGCALIPDGLSSIDAAMMDILAVCNHVADQGRIQPGEGVLVMGAGPAGNGIAQIARIQGAARIVLTDISDTALHVARKCGFTEIVDARGAGAEEEIASLLGPEGALSVFDSIGTGESISLGLRFLDKKGTLVNMAVHDSDMKLNQLALGGERRLVSSCNFKCHEHAEALGWLAGGRLDVKPWITMVKRGEVPSTFQKLLDPDKKRGLFKVVVTESGTAA